MLNGQWVALVGFGSAVLSCATRDRFVGLPDPERLLVHARRGQFAAAANRLLHAYEDATAGRLAVGFGG